jgi:hypothetical protein
LNDDAKGWEVHRGYLVGRRNSPEAPDLSDQVRRQKPAGNRLAAVGFVSKFDAGQTREPVGHIAVEAGGRDVVDNPVLGHHLAQLIGGDGVGRAVAPYTFSAITGAMKARRARFAGGLTNFDYVVCRANFAAAVCFQ